MDILNIRCLPEYQVVN